MFFRTRTRSSRHSTQLRFAACLAQGTRPYLWQSRVFAVAVRKLVRAGGVRMFRVDDSVEGRSVRQQRRCLV